MASPNHTTRPLPRSYALRHFNGSGQVPFHSHGRDRAPPGDVPPGFGLGYEVGALVFGGALAVIAALYFWTSLSRVLLFWAAFVLTRPLGATIGDFFDKPIAKGGLNVSRPLASAILAAIILACIFIFPHRAGVFTGARKT